MRIQICCLTVSILITPTITIKILIRFLLAQNIITFKSSSKINQLRKVKSRTVNIKKVLGIEYDAASELFHEQMGELDNEYIKLLKAEKNEFSSRYNISDLFRDDYDYSILFAPPLEVIENSTTYATTRS